MSGYLDGSCCDPDSGQCCGEGSWCCKRAGEHEHDEKPASAWDLLGIDPNYTGGKSSVEWIREQRDRS